jgi:hypothetical protein
MKKSHTGMTPYGPYHDCRYPVPAALRSIAQRRNGFMPARQFCDGRGEHRGMELPMPGR